MDDRQALPPPPQATNPFAIASVALAGIGVIVYCCGSFLCLGWIAPILWLGGVVCGAVAVSQGPEGSKTLAYVGIGLNVFFGVAFLALMVVGVGFGVLSALSGAAGSY